MHAFNPNKGKAYIGNMKARSPTKVSPSASMSSGRVVPLTGVITLSEKDFDRFEKNMRGSASPTQTARKAAELHATLAPILKQ